MQPHRAPDRGQGRHFEPVCDALRTHYDMGELKTVDGMVDFGRAKAAWFKHGEGNIYELSEVMAAA